MKLTQLTTLLPTAAALVSTDDTKRVAIIGAGAGGTSAAFHLARYAADVSIPTNITVFERNSYVGGRTTTVNAWGDVGLPIELGGSIFVQVNYIMVENMKRFNLSTASMDIAAQLAMPDLGVWNGLRFVIITRAEDSWWDTTKLLWRYGTAPLWTNRLMKKVVGQFLKMYEEPVFPWKSLNNVVEEMGLLEATGVTGEQYLKANGIGEAFSKEIIQASTRVNYASNLPYIHGLETLVCMATNGAMQIEGGNWQIFANMLNASQATTHMKSKVTKISKQKGRTYEISTGSGETSTFDEVIIAAPLQFTDIDINPAPKHMPDEIPYTKLHVTLFATPFKLAPQPFGLDIGATVPQVVLTTLRPDEKAVDDVGSPGFYSISLVAHAVNKHASKPRPEYIYKIFSPGRVTTGMLSKGLGHHVSDEEAEHGNVDGTISWIHRKVWHSYPKEYPRVTFEEIKLDHGLWYTSGIESLISTMETSALSGKNVARLLRDEWLRNMHRSKDGRFSDDVVEEEKQQVEL